MAQPLIVLKQDLRRSFSGSRSRIVFAFGGLLVALAIALPKPPAIAQAQPGESGTITLKADVQEANALTGVITARGNVQIDYPARDIVATSAQAQYFSEENRMILSGNVVVLQEGNRLEAETVTYLIDEGRFIALPQPNNQVETTYILTNEQEPAPTGPDGESTTDDVTDDAAIAPLPDATLTIPPID
jgi:lipopolysaccharide export system protein LptA